MNQTSDSANVEITKALIEKSFLAVPHFNPYDLEHFSQWLHRRFPGLLEPSELVNILQEHGLYGDGEFTPYAVNGGLVIKVYTQTYFATDLVMQHSWYVTGAGKSFMEKLYSIKRS